MSAIITASGHAVPTAFSSQEGWDTYFHDRFGALTKIAGQVWRHSGIRQRHSAIDARVEDVASWSTGQRMERFMTEALPLGKEAIGNALGDAGIAAEDLGLFAVVCCTGYGTPGLDLRLAADMGMASDVQRVHIGHMGCYAAIPGMRTVADFVLAHQKPALMLCLELTSLHLQPPTEDLEQIVAHAIFSDAAAAVVVQPGNDDDPTTGAAGWEVLDTVAVSDHATAALMTWDITDMGFRMGLSAQVPSVLAKHARPVTEKLLAKRGLSVEDVEGWAVHPGGRRIVEVIGEQLGLSDSQLAASFGVLDEFGNCSSPTVLLVLDRIQVAPGGYCVAMAFGPGLTLYMTLLRRR